jgi:hypothetical protein
MVTFLRLSSRVDLGPIGLEVAAITLSVPTAANSAVSGASSVISAGNGQLSPALASRFNLSRTVDGATPHWRASR